VSRAWIDVSCEWIDGNRAKEGNKSMKKGLPQDYHEELLSRQGFDKLGVSIYRNSIKEHERFVPPEDTREEQIRSCLWLVHSMAGKFLGRGVDYDDLVSSGNEGLVFATTKFNPVAYPGVKFGSYAVWWIRQRMIQEIHYRSRTIKIPTRIYEDYRKIRNAARVHSLSLTDPSDAAKLQEESGLSTDRIAKVIEHYEIQCLSLDHPLHFDRGDKGDSDACLVDGIPSEAPSQEDLYQTYEVHQRLDSLMGRLSPRERDIIERRWGCNGYGGEPQTMGECAEAHGNISRQRVQQLETRAMGKLRRAAGTSVKIGARKDPVRRTNRMKKEELHD